MTNSSNTTTQATQQMNSPISGDSTIFPAQITKTFIVEVYSQDDLNYIQGDFTQDFTADLEDSGFKLLEMDGVKVSA